MAFTSTGALKTRWYSECNGGFNQISPEWNNTRFEFECGQGSKTAECKRLPLALHPFPTLNLFVHIGISGPRFTLLESSLHQVPWEGYSTMKPWFLPFLPSHLSFLKWVFIYCKAPKCQTWSKVLGIQCCSGWGSGTAGAAPSLELLSQIPGFLKPVQMWICLSGLFLSVVWLSRDGISGWVHGTGVYRCVECPIHSLCWGFSMCVIWGSFLLHKCLKQYLAEQSPQNSCRAPGDPLWAKSGSLPKWPVSVLVMFAF